MHVLVLPSWFEDSRNPTSGSFFKDQAKALKSLGHQVGIIHPIAISLKAPQHFRFSQHTSDPQESLPILSHCYFTLPRCRALNIKRRIREYEKLYLNYQKIYGKPHVLHAHSCALGPFGSAGIAAQHLSQKYNLPYVITEHASAFHSGLYRQDDIPSILAAFDGAQGIITVSDSLSHDLRALGVTKPIQIISNVVDTQVFKQAAKHLASDSNHYRFISIAYLRPIKRLDRLIQAFAMASAHDDRIRLTLVGDGEQRTELERLVRKYGLNEKIRFSGELSRDELALELAQSDCYVLTSHYETFSVAVHEALAAGKAVISTPCGGPVPTLQFLSEVVLNDFDDKTLAAAMLEQAKKTEDESTKLVRQQYISENFNRVVIAKKIENVLEAALVK
jgi:glycosyltransferase involved in cell wall biosynthesis